MGSIKDRAAILGVGCTRFGEHWERDHEDLLVEAAYEATLHAALLNASRGMGHGSHRVYLTLLGGGVFGNRREWILAAIRRALDLMRGQDLEVWLVSYGSVPDDLKALAAEYGSDAA